MKLKFPTFFLGDWIIKDAVIVNYRCYMASVFVVTFYKVSVFDNFAKLLDISDNDTQLLLILSNQ